MYHVSGKVHILAPYSSMVIFFQLLHKLHNILKFPSSELVSDLQNVVYKRKPSAYQQLARESTVIIS